MHRSQRAGDRAYEAAREKVAALPQRRATTREIIFTRGTTEAINLVAQSFGPDVRQARRRDRRHRRWSTTRTSSRGRCSASETRRACCASCRSTTRASCGLDELEKLLLAAHAARRGHARLERARHGQPGRARSSQLAHARGAASLVDGAQAVAAPAGRRAGARLRLLRVLGPQDVRPDGHRRALRQGDAARGDAALPGRRRHDPPGHLREDAPTTSCRTSSRRARRTSPARSASARRSTTLQRGRPRARRGARARAARLRRPRRSAAIPGLRLIGTAPQKAGVALVRARRRPPARHRHDPRPRGHRDPHRPPLRAAGDGRASASPATARASLAFYNTRGGGRRARRAGSAKVSEVVRRDDRRSATSTRRSSSTTASKPRNFRALAERREPQGRGLQPALRRPASRVYLKLERRRARRTSRFEGSGCAISTASASLMTEALKGKTDAEAERAVRALPRARHRRRPTGRRRRSASSRCSPGVSEFPVRVKCATLAWHTLRAALHEAAEPVSTE